jgi:transcriptional regulator with XRE-family HTH domain
VVGSMGCVSGAPRSPRTASPAPPSGEFAAALRSWRSTRGLSQAALAKQIMYSRSMVNLVENGYHRATEALAQAVDAALDAAGQLHAAWTSTDVALAQPAHEPQSPVLADRAACAPRDGAAGLAGTAVMWLAVRGCTEVLIIVVRSTHQRA